MECVVHTHQVEQLVEYKLSIRLDRNFSPYHQRHSYEHSSKRSWSYHMETQHILFNMLLFIQLGSFEQKLLEQKLLQRWRK